jgi:hypothetical protein
MGSKVTKGTGISGFDSLVCSLENTVAGRFKLRRESDGA